MLEQASVEEMFQKYGEMLYKICIVMLKNTYDAEDTVQDVLIKYMTKKPLLDNQILAILLELPSKYKEVLLLYYVEGYKCFEISKILKITESTVKKRLERGRKLLKKKLGVNECG